MEFTKMHGCGNDYIFIKNFEGVITKPGLLSKKLSNRNFGIGADGLILIEKSDKADAKMTMFNSDGSEGKMCGNGIRCVGKYLFDNGLSNKKKLKIETASGIKTLKLNFSKGKVVSVNVNMGLPVFESKKIPTLIKSPLNASLNIDDKKYFVSCLSMGNPHCVIFLAQDIDSLDLKTLGPKFEKNKVFIDKVNVEFVNIIGQNHFRARVWERGSGETLACGTGACAIAVAAVLNNYADKNKTIKISLAGGTLKIKCTDKGVFLSGNAVEVFKGNFFNI